jgi:FkbM family methyltransferase
MLVLKPMITYAQNFEDVMLRRVFDDRNDGFYIDVGAMDPVFDSVTNYFYEQGWSGINIEPNEWFYNKLVAQRPRDINLNVAVGEREERRPLYIFEQYGNSTFDESSRDRFAEKGHEVEEKIVKITTLATICNEYATRPIDFLKIDCEGWEKAALEGADWDRFHPTVVIVEATEPGTTVPSWAEWQPLLENARYEMVYFDGLNRFFLHRDCEKLRCHFGSPPNIFDDFRTRATVVAQQASRALQEERDSLATRVAELATRAAELEKRSAELEKKTQEDSAEIARLDEELRSTQTRAAQLDQALLKSRLWVGQLSQELAASRRRLQR